MERKVSLFQQNMLPATIPLLIRQNMLPAMLPLPLQTREYLKQNPQATNGEFKTYWDAMGVEETMSSDHTLNERQKQIKSFSLKPLIFYSSCCTEYRNQQMKRM